MIRPQQAPVSAALPGSLCSHDAPMIRPQWRHHWPLWLLAAVLLGVGLGGWIDRGERSAVGRLRPPSQPANPMVPIQPPARPRWVSPLVRSCQSGDPEQRLRLEQRLRALRSSVATVQIHPTNYGQRFQRDVFGRRLDSRPQLVVLHETVYGIGSAINTFVTPHPSDNDQVSYHALIGQDGSVVQVLDPSKRAFGAGNSAFNGQWVMTNPQVGGSVNNFALHVSLETPLDGEDNAPTHSGYTPAQYDALAALLAEWMARYPIPPEHITTHAHVDLGGERSDPRSFQWAELNTRLQNLGSLCG